MQAGHPIGNTDALQSFAIYIKRAFLLRATATASRRNVADTII
jgi:hypothetical protein